MKWNKCVNKSAVHKLSYKESENKKDETRKKEKTRGKFEFYFG